jgi:hypothetical protein
MNSLAVRRGGKAAPLVQIRAQGIACDLHARVVNSRQRRVTYELSVANRGDVRVSCRIYGLDASGHTREFGMLTIARQSAGNSLFAVPFASADGRRLYVEVVGDGINLFAEAFQPGERVDTVWPKIAVACALVFVSTAFGTASVFSRNGVARPAAHFDAAVARYAHPKRLALRSTLTTSGAPPSARKPIERVTDRHISLASLLAGAWLFPSSHRSPGVAPAAKTDVTGLLLPAHAIAGRSFSVAIRNPSPGLHISFEDNLRAIVDEVAVSAKTERITFAAPPSSTEQTYYLASTGGLGAWRETTVRTLRVYPP